MWVGSRQSKNAPYRKGENIDGMEVQENEAQREGKRERVYESNKREKDRVIHIEEDWLEPRTGCINARIQKKRWWW